MGSINQENMMLYEIGCGYKKMLVFTVLAVVTSSLAMNVKAQTFAEWFKQKSTQKKYLLQQIAALKVYAAYYNAGNNIAHNGLGSITGSLFAENGFHAFYYDNLKNISPVVKNNKQIKEILQWQKDILTRMSKLDKTANLSDDEKKYIKQVKAALLNDCDEEITALQNVVTDSKLKMSDKERLNHIGLIHTAMQNNYRFSSEFSEQVNVYVIQRVQENNILIVEKKIYGLQ